MFDVCLISFINLFTDARTLNIARTLSKNNFKVCIVAIGTYDQKKFFEQENIFFYPLNVANIKKASFRFLNFIKEIRKIYKELSSNYFLAGDVYSLYIARKLQKIHSGKIVYDCREIYSALIPNTQTTVKQNFLIKFEKHFLKYLSAIIVTSELDKEYLQPYFNISIPYYTIMNLPPYKDYIENDYFRNLYNIDKNIKIILYQGMLHPGRGLERIIESIKILKNCVLIIIGEGYYKNKLIELTKINNVENQVFFHDPVEYDKLHFYSCSADIGYCFIEPITTSYYYALPNKLFEYCQAHLPVIASELPAMKRIIDQYRIGKYIPPNADKFKIAETINELIENSETYKKNCLLASKKLNFEEQEAIILDIFKKY